MKSQRRQAFLGVYNCMAETEVDSEERRAIKRSFNWMQAQFDMRFLPLYPREGVEKKNMCLAPEFSLRGGSCWLTEI